MDICVSFTRTPYLGLKKCLKNFNLKPFLNLTSTFVKVNSDIKQLNIPNPGSMEGA